MNAWCDGFLINGSPWHCLCCTRLRKLLSGKSRKFLKQCNTRNLGVLNWELIINNRRELYVWPCTKHVYPDVDGWVAGR